MKPVSDSRSAAWPARNFTAAWRTLLRRGLLLLVGLSLLLLGGCGRRVPPYWPDLAVNEGVVYVAEANGQLFALQADSGDLLWQYPIVEQKKGGLLGGCSARALSDGPFFAAPAVEGNYVYLSSAGALQRSLFGKGENMAGLRALDRNGTLQWSFKDVGDRSVASPTVANGVVYLPSSDHKVYAVDVETHQVRWTFETGNWVWASPLVVSDTVYIASMDHVLYAVDAANGRLRWRFDRPRSALPAAPAYATGTLYLGSLDGHIYAIRASGGELLWEQKVEGNVWATPVVNGEVLYFGTLRGKVYALRTQDGSEVWQKDLESEVRGTPAYVNGTLYFGCESGRLYAFDARTGEAKPSPLDEPLRRASIYTSPVFDGQRLYIVATDGQVIALDPERNVTVWKVNPLELEREDK